MLKIKLSLIASLFLLVFPSTTLAYLTTNQTAVKLNDNVFLYTVSYEFGASKSDLVMPIMALPKTMTNDRMFAVGYESIDSEGEPAKLGNRLGLVLSNAKVVDGRYIVPKGTLVSFTLIVLVQVTDAEIVNFDAEQNLALRVTSLPFIIRGINTETTAQLNPTELQYYQTPALNIH